MESRGHDCLTLKWHRVAKSDHVASETFEVLISLLDDLTFSSLGPGLRGKPWLILCLKIAEGGDEPRTVIDPVCQEHVSSRKEVLLVAANVRSIPDSLILKVSGITR